MSEDQKPSRYQPTTPTVPVTEPAPRQEREEKPDTGERRRETDK